MRKTNKFIFACITAVILFNPISIKNALAAHEDTKHESQVKNKKHKEIFNTEIKNHEEEATEQISHIWPHYGKMVIFAEILLTFMIFSFVAPLVHFYVKGIPNHTNLTNHNFSI